MILVLVNNEDLYYTAFLEAEIESEQKAQNLLSEFKEAEEREADLNFTPEDFQYFLERKKIASRQLSSIEITQLHFA